MLSRSVLPVPDRFREYLQDYCEQAEDAAKRNKHHDQRRALFMDFLRKAFDVQVEEVELEHKVKAASARGRIDAFYRFVIFEFKTDLEREREDAISELTKYFRSQKNPADFIAAVTDGLDFEVFDHDPTSGPKLIRSFKLESEVPVGAYSQLDELLAAGRKIRPLSGEVVARFGPGSVVFNRSRQALHSAYELVRDLSSVQVKFREWNVLLAKVYGAPPEDQDLFLRHTYLTMVSRAIVTLAVFRERQHSTALYRGLMNGEFFRNKSIKNLAETDFFSWGLGTAAEAAFFEFFANLFRRLGEFDWSQVDEDLLKVLYQELVESGDRQQLGEFYTPDWLAELTLDDIDYRRGTLLDPACGSGTFLFCAVRRLRAAGLEGNELVRTALDSVTGIDVHPVAALMAKANILLALSAELPKYPDEVYLRVYLADTLMTGEDTKKKALAIKAGERESFYIPLESIEKGRDLDTLIDKLIELAERGAKSDEAKVRADQGFVKALKDYSPRESFLWRENLSLAVDLVKHNRNSVWAFILKNAYRPAYLRRQKVDVIVANPPWLSLRDIQDAAYKAKVKELAFNYELLERTDRKLFTQLDTATVFFAHAQHEFLREGGTMAFVMPRSVILPAKQHVDFQKGGFTRINDFGEVKGLFKVPACVLVRRSRVVVENIPIDDWSGDLPRGQRNLSWEQAKPLLRSAKGTWSFLSLPEVRSPYFTQVIQGATLVPRALWFVEPAADRPLVVRIPFLRTSRAAIANADRRWKENSLEGRVESEFLFGTALAEDLIPFAVRQLRLVVLPIAAREERFVMLGHQDILAEGTVGAADWVEKAEKIWGAKKKTGQPNLNEYINYDQKITRQNPKANFVVLYNKSGTNIAAAYITPAEHKQIGQLQLQGFVADHVTYRYYADSEDHALYLVGVLNSAIVNDAIKPYQSQGLQGERDIHRRPFEVCPIPLFDLKNQLHGQIADVARDARVKMLKWKLKIGGNAAQARKAARKIVQAELDQLDSLVAELLNGHELVAQAKQDAARVQMLLPRE
jgi:type I restriction-modification system DNA methylase subunit